MREKSNVGILNTKRSHSNYNVPQVSAKIDAFYRKKASILAETSGAL